MTDRICPRVEGERYIDDERLNSGVPELQAMSEATLKTLEVVSVDDEQWYSVPAMIDGKTGDALLWSTISIGGAETRYIEWSASAGKQASSFINAEEITIRSDGVKMSRLASVGMGEQIGAEEILISLNERLLTARWNPMKKIPKGGPGKDSYDEITQRTRNAFAGRPFVFRTR